MKTKMLTLIALLLINPGVKAQNQEQEISSLTCKAYLMNSNTFWAEAVNKSKAYAEKNNADKNAQLLYINTLFGMLNATLVSKDKETYNAYINEAENAIEDFIEQHPDNARILCIKSALYGVKMAYAPWKGMFYGPKSGELISKAMKEDPELPQVWVRQASSEYFTPETYGGNKWKSMETYQKAIDKFEAYENDLAMNWEYLDALAWLGIAQMKNEQYDDAQATFNKALKVQPNFPWVKNALLPEATSLAQNSKQSGDQY